MHPDYVHPDDSPLHRLFSKLGVKEGGIVETCRIIKDFHTNKNMRAVSSPDECLEQLFYWFKASKAKKFNDAVPDMRVIDLTGRVMKASQIYQPQLLCREGLEDLLEGTTASQHFMHPMYLNKVDGEDCEKFSEWLDNKLHALRELRIGVIGEKALTDESKHLIVHSSLPKMKILEIVVDAWTANFGSRVVLKAASTTLRNMTAIWMHGVPVKLEATFLPTKAVKDVVPEGMPFLDVVNPGNEKWKALKHVGVVTDTSSQSSEFWLSCLRGIMQQPKPHKAAVTKTYQCLSRCEAGGTW